MENPLEPDKSKIFEVSFDKTKLDGMMLRGEMEYDAGDGGVVVHSGSRKFKVTFDTARFRPAEVPILFSDTRKINLLGFKAERSVRDIIRDQLNYYLSDRDRKGAF